MAMDEVRGERDAASAIEMRRWRVVAQIAAAAADGADVGGILARTIDALAPARFTGAAYFVREHGRMHVVGYVGQLPPPEAGPTTAVVRIRDRLAGDGIVVFASPAPLAPAERAELDRLDGHLAVALARATALAANARRAHKLAHDIKGPLAIIMANLEFLEHDQAQHASHEDSRAALHDLRAGADQLSSLIMKLSDGT